MASETPSHYGLIRAVRARRRNLTPRVAAGALLALMASRLIGWNAVVPWIAAYGALQLAELWAWTPAAANRASAIPGWRAAFGCLAIFLSSTAFGAISVPLWKVGGGVGAICAAFLLAAAIVNAVVTSPGSRPLLAAAVGPHFAYVAALVSAAGRFAAKPELEGASALGALVFCAYAMLLWRTLEKSHEAEATAQLEAEQRQAELEAALAAKSRFTAVLGHELRTPLSALLAGATEVKARTADADQLNRLLLIEDAGQLMKSLLDDILDQAKLDAHRMTIEETPFSLRELLAQTLRMWRCQAEAKGLKLKIEGADQAPDRLIGDSTRLRQILNNLVSNAVKFTAEGSVTLSVSAWPADDGCCALMLRVIDTGEGMAPEQASRLFTPFEQMAASTARNFGGTGLGLVISRQLARLMGGEVSALSCLGRGTTFTLAVTLPVANPQVGEAEASDPLADLDSALAPAAAAAAAPETEAGPQAEPVATAEPEAEAETEAEDRPLRVLVADDHEINRRAVEVVLSPLGARITSAVDGRQALGAALLEAFDIIVMDVRMPEMNGRDATRKIRGQPGPNRHTPVIAVTADSDAADVEACREAGMNWFVAKPIDPAKLVQTVVDALEEAERDAAERAVA
jgi:two-component system, sensor histidine kinase